MAKQIPGQANTVAGAGRPMLVRAKPLEPADRVARRPTPDGSAARGIRYLAVSREAGSGGEDVARMVAERLGWGVYDKSRLDDLVQQFQVSGTILDAAEETPGNWARDPFGGVTDSKILPRDYAAQLGQVISEVSKRGNAVFIGRGAQFVLPRGEVLAVRIIASEKHRILQIAATTGAAGAAAHQSISAQDEGRRQFVQRSFHHDLTDPHEYDLVINVELCGQQRAANLILTALTGQIATAARSAQ
jgi:cytidylate kinase